MILELEGMIKDDEDNNPPGDLDVYIEDEIHNSDDELDNDDGLQTEAFSNEDYEIHFELKRIKSVNLLTSSRLVLCKCDVEKQLSVLMENKHKLEKIFVENSVLSDLKVSLLEECNKSIDSGRKHLQKFLENCHHNHELNKDIVRVMDCPNTDAQKISKYVDSCKKTIEKNMKAKKLNIAPAEKGEWINWKSDVFLEEKLFPSLFPYGIGGYISSNLLKQNDMGFANYVKNRLLSANPKFRKDTSYVFFLLLVKELIDMKRSEQTVFRKANRASNLTAKAIKEIGKENLLRYDTAFTAFRSIRGTAPYYMDTKKKLMATVRQKGPPTLFTTFSSAEFDWVPLLKCVYETVHKKSITTEELTALSTAEKNKLINENVVQTTQHFAKRTEKLFSILNDGHIFVHNGIDFKVDSYFYRYIN